MGWLADILVDGQRKADLVQARRIAAARADLTRADRNRYRRPGAPDTVVHDDRRLIPGGAGLPDRNAESNARISRAQAVLNRAEQIGSPRARAWGAALHEWGSIYAPSRRPARTTQSRGRSR